MSHSLLCSWAPGEAGHNSCTSKLVWVVSHCQSSWWLFSFIFFVLSRPFAYFYIHWSVMSRETMFISCSLSSCEGNLLSSDCTSAGFYLTRIVYVQCTSPALWKLLNVNLCTSAHVTNSKSMLPAITAVWSFHWHKVRSSISRNLWEFGPKPTSLAVILRFYQKA